MEVDYLIVGAGTAGCVLATRLSEDQRSEVLLIEAGGTDRRPDVMVPGAASRLHRSSADWGFYTTPQRALGGRRIYVPRGKVIGGSGSTNTLIAIRGVPLDYDEWAEGGASGWAWEDVQPVFRRIRERMRPALPTEMHPLVDVFLRAADEVGLPRNHDGYQSDELEGIGPYAFHVAKARRLSTAGAYLRPAMRRKNLQGKTGIQVRELAFDGKRCVGIRYRRGREMVTIRARREVIVAAGAIGSPHLLLLSGIGPEAHLRGIGIQPRHELPVGEGLQDHPIVHMADLSSQSTLNTTIESVPTVMDYLVRRRGVLAWPLPIAGGFARTQPGPRPDIQFHFVPGWAHDPHDFNGLPPEDGYILASTVCKPKSRGRVRLASPFPEEPPVIDPALLEHEDDMAAAVRGAEVSQQVLEAQAFKGWSRGPVRPRSRCNDAADFEQFVRQACGTTYHPSCTCAIGSVVDPQLRVKGLDGLRVIDASVMPSVTTANTNLPTIMIAERGADLIQGGVTG